MELPAAKEVSAFGKHPVSGVAISPDGRTLAAGYWDLVTLWDLSSGERLAALTGFKDYVGCLSFSPEGKLLAGCAAREIQIWDVGRRSRVASVDIEDGWISDLAFSPDNRFVAAGAYGTGTAWLLDLISLKIVGKQKVSDMGCGSVAFSPDGRFLITPSTGGLITWPYDQGGTIRVFRVNAR